MVAVVGVVAGAKEEVTAGVVAGAKEEVTVGEVVAEVTGAAPTQVARAKAGEKVLILLVADRAERPPVRAGNHEERVVQWVPQQLLVLIHAMMLCGN